MFRKLFQKISTIRVLYSILIVFLLITIVNIFYHLIAGQYETVTAVAITTSNTETFQGVYIRNETVIKYNGEGIMSYEISDGGKLGIGSVIANVYKAEKDIASKRKINELKKDLELLEKITNPGTMEVAQPATLTTLIEERYKNIAFCKDMNNSTQLETETMEFLSLLSTMQYITGQTNPDVTNSFESKIESINAEIVSLERQMSAPLDTIISDNSAYFVSHIDGYEEKLSKSVIDSLTVDFLKSVKDDVVISDNSSEKIVGKFIDDYKWNIAGIIKNNNSVFKSGDKVMLSFELSNEKITGVIDEIRATQNPDENIVIISCDVMNSDLVQHRTENVKMSIENYEGIKVPRKAIRFSGDEKGVYIKLGENVVFKKIEVIFEGDDYVISAANPDSDYLMLYDDIITEGIDVD
ncbi:MAG: HlyD family efflux transporter periplasmic adaptor subunit [Oscillospiraceae bacterium]